MTLGRFSLQTFMPGARIGSAHGTVRPVDPATGAADALALALYHPAAAFRQTALKETLFEDMANVPEALLRSRETRAAGRTAIIASPAHGPTMPDTISDPSTSVERIGDLEPVAVAVADDPDQLRLF